MHVWVATIASRISEAFPAWSNIVMVAVQFIVFHSWSRVLADILFYAWLKLYGAGDACMYVPVVAIATIAIWTYVTQVMCEILIDSWSLVIHIYLAVIQHFWEMGLSCVPIALLTALKCNMTIEKWDRALACVVQYSYTWHDCVYIHYTLCVCQQLHDYSEILPSFHCLDSCKN